MNDRYLYRAKRKDNGEWISGYLYGIWERKYILWGMINDVPDMKEVDPSTICQCTGLKDKNVNLIWENDIVEIVSSPKRSYKYLIWWNREMSLMDAIPLDGLDFNGHDYWNGNYSYFRYETFCAMMQDPWGDFSDIKVIGNIFDNPELMNE